MADREVRTKVDFLPGLASDCSLANSCYNLALVSYHFRDKTSGVSQAGTSITHVGTVNGPKGCIQPRSGDVLWEAAG